MSAGSILWGSLSDNWYILLGALFDLVCLGSAVYFSYSVKKSFSEKNGDGLQRRVYYFLDVSYTLFLAVISLFPLLGMFGTVRSLIGLGGVFSSENADLNAIKPQFFTALTSTAWGIIFSIIFKIIGSFFQPFIENQIDRAKKLLGL